MPPARRTRWRRVRTSSAGDCVISVVICPRMPASGERISRETQPSSRAMR
jgi:hypothetical protein